MSIALPYRFMLTAILFVLIGMVLGLYMGPSGDARLVPVQQRRPRRPGLWKGRVIISPDFDAPLPELDEAFES